MTTSPCPSFEMLSAFVDRELTSTDDEAVLAHVATCERCREELLDWADAEQRVLAADCLDPELLVAYSDGVLTAAEQRPVTIHLATCPRCRSEVEAMAGIGRHVPAPIVTPWRERIAAALTAFGAVFVRPGPLLSALTATALVIIALTQLVPKNELPHLGGLTSAPQAQTSSLERQRSAEPQAGGIVPKDQRRELDALRAGSEPEQRPLPQAAAPPAAPASEPPVLMRKAAPKADDEKKNEQAPLALRGRTDAGEATRQALTDESASGARIGGGLRQGFAGSAVDERRWAAPLAKEESADAEVKGAGGPGVLAGHVTPTDDSPIVARFKATELQRRVEERNGWTLVELTEHRQAWVRTAELNAMVTPDTHGQ